MLEQGPVSFVNCHDCKKKMKMNVCLYHTFFLDLLNYYSGSDLFFRCEKRFVLYYVMRKMKDINTNLKEKKRKGGNKIYIN